MFFLKNLNGIFSFFFRLQWTPIAPSKTRKTCSFMFIRNSINQIQTVSKKMGSSLH